jgi:hypothetical protein
MEELTERQDEILDYCRDFFSKNHQLPPAHVIAAEFEFNLNAAVTHLKILAKKGYLAKNQVGKYKFSDELTGRDMLNTEFDKEGKKICTECGERKHKSDYYKRHGGVKVKHFAKCIKCQSAENLARYHKKQAKNPDTKKNRDKTEFGNFNKYLTMRFTQ